MNNLKTFILLAVLTALMLGIGNLLAGRTGMMFALIFAIIMNGGAYWFSDTMVLKMYKAIPLKEDHEIYQIVSKLAHQAHTPVPKVYLVESEVPNAFATGRNPEHAAIAVTSGLLERLNEEELNGVIAHEMCHILHRDTLISVITATLAGAISSIGNLSMLGGTASSNNSDGNRPNPVAGIVMVVIAPIAAGLIQMAVSRSREFEADAGGAKLTKNPMGLAHALQKLEVANSTEQFKQVEEHPTTAHLFIVNPLRGEKFASMFSTHPSTKERIERLEAMAKGQY